MGFVAGFVDGLGTLAGEVTLSLLGRAGADAIAGPSKYILVPLFGLPMGIGWAIALLLVSFAFRLTATAVHFLEGVSRMPQNFRRLAISTSPLQSPE